MASCVIAGFFNFNSAEIRKIFMAQQPLRLERVNTNIKICQTFLQSPGSGTIKLFTTVKSFIVQTPGVFLLSFSFSVINLAMGFTFSMTITHSMRKSTGLSMLFVARLGRKQLTTSDYIPYFIEYSAHPDFSILF